jgi:hypothetical protein
VQPDVLPLVPVCSEHFTRKAMDSDRRCTEFCMQNGLNTTAFNIFLTVEHLPADMRDQPPRDVILMNRVLTITDNVSILILCSLISVELLQCRDQRSYSLVLKPVKCLI